MPKTKSGQSQESLICEISEGIVYDYVCRLVKQKRQKTETAFRHWLLEKGEPGGTYVVIQELTRPLQVEEEVSKRVTPAIKPVKEKKGEKDE